MRTWPLLVFLFASSGLMAAPLATLSGLEGDVSVIRSGKVIPSEKVGDGFSLEPYDTVTTGTSGRADLKLLAASGVSGSLRLDSGTSLYLEFSSQKREQTIGIEVIQGGLATKITAVSGASQLELRTSSALLLLGPSTSRLVLSSAGDLLLGVSQGKVSCRVENRTLFAEPGNAIEIPVLDQNPQSIPVNAATLSSFETTWVQQKAKDWRDRASVYCSFIVARYQRQVGLFQRAWERIEKEGLDDTGVTQAGVSSLRLAGAPLERSLAPIQALRKLFDEGILPPTLELTRGFLAKDFFRQSVRELPLWASRLAEARGFYRSVADKNRGEFPKATKVVGVTWDSPYFR